MTAQNLRQPIVTIMGHVDHGKTTLLDKIRTTTVAQKEPGQITQAIGASIIPKNVIEKICGKLLQKFKFSVNVPGLLFIDTPGHEAFTTLRRRGGAIADLAVLVVDIAEGLKPQTIESLEILKGSKTPFVIAVNKIDRIQGWRADEKPLSFLESFQNQSSFAQRAFDESFYKVLEQISRHGFGCDRYDRINDFTKTIAAVPTSGKTGEGVPDLLAMLIGLSQAFLKKQLLLTENVQGSVLEVKEATGLGTTLDVILYDGTLKKGDYLVVGGKVPLVTRIKALLEPAPLKEMRVEKKFQPVEEVRAATGVKISAPGLESVIAGSPIRATKSMEEAKKMFAEFQKELQKAEIVTENEGLIIKSDTIGSLEAMEVLFKEFPVKEATLGSPSKETILRAEANKDPFHKIVIVFNLPISDEVRKVAKDRKINVLESNIIYHLHEEYVKWRESVAEEMRKKELEGVTKPAKLRLLPGYVFRASNPAVIGSEITGLLRAGCSLIKPEKGVVGKVMQIQKEGKTVLEAKSGERVAVSIEGPVVGRQIVEGDILYTDVTTEEYKKMKKLSTFLSDTEKHVLQEIFELKRKTDPRFGL